MFKSIDDSLNNKLLNHFEKIFINHNCQREKKEGSSFTEVFNGFDDKLGCHRSSLEFGDVIIEKRFRSFKEHIAYKYFVLHKIMKNKKISNMSILELNYLKET